MYGERPVSGASRVPVNVGASELPRLSVAETLLEYPCGNHFTSSLDPRCCSSSLECLPVSGEVK